MNKNMSHLLNKLLQATVILFGLLGAHHSYAGACSPLFGSPYIYDYTVNLTTTQNVIGYETAWMQLNRPEYYQVSPPCHPGVSATFFTLRAGPGMTDAGNTGGTFWFDLPENDYLQVAAQVFIAGKRDEYFHVPTESIDNRCSQSSPCSGQYGSGGQVQIKLRVKKKFVGKSFIINRDVSYIYAASTAADKPIVDPVAIVRLNATMTVPQSCTFDVGDVIEFDFGRIPSSAFAGVGAGNRAQGVNTITKNIGIECKSIDAQQMLSARVETNNPNNNILVSDNPDVGFQIADKDERILRLNDITSFIPFRLDENGRSNFILNAWPVSVTGNKPIAGPVNAAGYVRIDFR